jgi:hypothetical protein
MRLPDYSVRRRRTYRPISSVTIVTARRAPTGIPRRTWSIIGRGTRLLARSVLK